MCLFSFILQWNWIPGSWGLFLIPFWFDVRSPFNVITRDLVSRALVSFLYRIYTKMFLIIDPTYVYRHIIYIFTYVYIYFLFISLILKWTWFPGSWFHLCTKHIQEGSPRSIPYIYIFIFMYI